MTISNQKTFIMKIILIGDSSKKIILNLDDIQLNLLLEYIKKPDSTFFYLKNNKFSWLIFVNKIEAIVYQEKIIEGIHDLYYFSLND